MMSREGFKDMMFTKMVIKMFIKNKIEEVKE